MQRIVIIFIQNVSYYKSAISATLRAFIFCTWKKGNIITIYLCN